MEQMKTLFTEIFEELTARYKQDGNAAGLEAIGSNLLRETPASGPPTLSNPGVDGVGRLVSGYLERSNVDTAEQFVYLIEAQRGYQANARIISAQDDLLQETVNLI